MRYRGGSLALWLALLACGGGDGLEPASTEHCDYVPLPPTAGAGGQVSAGAVRVGLAERTLDMPVGSALGGNTSRATAIGNAGWVDNRRFEHSGAFTPAVGIETVPKVKAVAIEAGDETVVLLRTDTIFSDDTITHDLADRLGPDFAGKVLWMSSHTHTAPEQYTADSKLQVGGGRYRDLNRARLTARMEQAARAALDDLTPARIGIAVDSAFDLDSAVSYDRREENDHLHGRSRADEYLAVIRIDGADGRPRAVLPVFGVHSAVLSDDTALFSTDVSGMYEKLIEEQFDHQVMVVHLQGAGGDVLPSSHRHIQLADGQHDWDFARAEENGRRALPLIMPLWERAGEAMAGELAMEMVTRSIEVGPDWRTFTVRDGALEYAPFDWEREADRVLYNGDGTIASPIDEFNAPFGAGLCGDPADDIFQGSAMPNVRGIEAYHSCARLPEVTLVLGALIDAEFEGEPICSSTRTTVTAWRLGDYLFATGPGEPLVDWADRVRELSPADPDKTVILGYAQGHVGYLLTARDWLIGGFEPSINLWGPLEGELIAERLAEVMALAVTDTREDAAAGGVDRLSGPMISDPGTGEPDPAPLAGSVPEVVPEELLARTTRPAQAQPLAEIPRVTGVARFVWIGEDPRAGTPRVVLERETAGGFEPVRRRSGRVVDDLDLLLLWTPLPLRPADDEPRTHFWMAEWQAVSWHGAADLPALADRPGVPLGRYRLRVDGTDYSLASDPFEVVAGPLAVRVARAGDDLRVETGYEATDGWRLLAMDGISNRWLPVTSPVSVELRYSAGDPQRLEVTPGADGAAVVTPSDPDSVVQLEVRDRFGNRGVVPVPGAQ